MNFPSIVLWGFVATLVLSTLMTSAQKTGQTRMAIPFLIGTAFTANRSKAVAIGFGIHLAIGWLFALVYAAIFEAVGTSNWWLGTLLGLGHAAVLLAGVVPVLPGMHPRMASEHRGPEPTRALEPPGFLALNYGARTPLTVLVSHAAYGAILGAFYQLG